MIEAPVCFNSLRRRAEALFFIAKLQREGLKFSIKTGNSSREEKRGNHFYYSLKQSFDTLTSHPYKNQNRCLLTKTPVRRKVTKSPLQCSYPKKLLPRNKLSNFINHLVETVVLRQQPYKFFCRGLHVAAAQPMNTAFHYVTWNINRN